MLAAARARQINLFGEFDSDIMLPYATRAAVSLKQHTFTEIGGDVDPDIDAQGRRILFASTRHNLQSDLYLKSIDGVAVTQLTSDPASDVQPAFSPDGTQVAFASNRSGNWDIWIMSVDGGQPAQVTDGLSDDIHPSWAPDGRRLVYCSLPAQGGPWELWITDAHAGATRKYIGDGLFPEWSPHGDQILFQRARERGSRRFSVWTLTMVNGEPRYPTELASSARQAFVMPTWSADATRVAFTSVVDMPVSDEQTTDEAENPPTPEMDIWIISASGRGRTRLTDGHTRNHAPVFALDGRLFFTSGRKGQDNIWSLWPSEVAPPLWEPNEITQRHDGITSLSACEPTRKSSIVSQRDDL